LQEDETMQGRTLKKIALALAVGLLLALAVVAESPAAGGGVTLVNESNHAVHLYARFGSEGACEAQPKKDSITIAAGQSQTIDSAGKVCICLQDLERNSCPSGWGEVKAGGKRIFR
jgi:hypothetical protein